MFQTAGTAPCYARRTAQADGAFGWKNQLQSRAGGAGYAQGQAMLKPDHDSAMPAEVNIEGCPFPPIKRLQARPGVDDSAIIDLTGAADVVSELGKSDAMYIEICAGGENVWLEVAAAPGLVDAIAERAAHGFDPNTFFSFAGDVLTVGTEVRATEASVGVATARNLLDKSNKNEDDKVWEWVNGGATALDKSELAGDKPRAWYNAYSLDGDKVTANRSGAPALTLVQYRQMLIADFNFNGAITQFQALGGVEPFTQAMLARWGAVHPLGEAGLTLLAAELWAYATTGADSTGKTDIAQMQGLLYQLDEEIMTSSNSNTPMSDDAFQLNGSSAAAPIMLNKGDGKHGRATTLTTRHLLANVDFQVILPTCVSTYEPAITGRDRFVTDDSGSMNKKWETIVAGADKELGLGSSSPDMANRQPSLGEHVDAEIEHREIRVEGESIYKWGEVLEKAYDRLYPAPTQADAEAFAAMMNLTGEESRLFDRHWRLKGDKLMKLLGDIAPNRDMWGDRISGQDKKYGAAGESGVKATIATLLYGSEYTPEALEGLDPAERPRLNIIQDEPEQALEYLPLAKLLAAELGVEVRLIAVPTGKEDDFARNPSPYMAFIDIQTMDISRTGDTDWLSFTATVDGEEKEKKVEIKQGGVDNAGWQNTYAPLYPGQRRAGYLE